MNRRSLFSIILLSIGFVNPAAADNSWLNISAWFSAAPTPAPVVCLGTTSTRDLSVENALRNPTANSYLKFWTQPSYRQRYLQACRAEAGLPLNSGNLSLAEVAASNLAQPQISRACIRQAIRSRANDNVEATRTMCAPRSRQLNVTPCLSERYVGFIHDTLNSAIRCVSARNNLLDPDLVFDMINNESAFMGFVHSSRGVGLLQMTSIAAREIFNTNEAGRAHLDAMMSRPEKRGFCDPFRRLIRPSEGRIDTCAYVGMDDGIARSAIAGIGLLSYYQSLARDMIATAGIPRRSANFEVIARQFALIGYNAGMTQAKVVLDKLGARAIARHPNPAQLIRGGAVSWIDNEYLVAMRRSRGQVRGLPRTCGELPGTS